MTSTSQLLVQQTVLLLLMGWPSAQPTNRHTDLTAEPPSTEVRLVNLELQKGVTLHGQVTLDSVPKSNDKIAVNLLGETKIFKDGSSRTEQFDSGELSFIGVLAKSQYCLRAKNRWWSEGRIPKFAHRHVVEVESFELGSLNTSVSGIVVDTSGSPVAGVKVVAMRRYRDVSNADGSFVVTKLPSGKSPISLMAYIDSGRDGETIRLPAKVNVVSGERDVRVVYDRRLARGPRELRVKK